MAEDCYRAYNLIKNWISNQSVIKMEYISFDAVFHALSKYGLEDRGKKCGTCSIIGNTEERPNFAVGYDA